MESFLKLFGRTSTNDDPILHSDDMVVVGRAGEKHVDNQSTSVSMSVNLPDVVKSDEKEVAKSEECEVIPAPPTEITFAIVPFTDGIHVINESSAAVVVKTADPCDVKMVSPDGSGKTTVMNLLQAKTIPRGIVICSTPEAVEEHVKKTAIDQVCQLMATRSTELEKETDAELAAAQSRVSSIMNQVQKGMEEKFKQMEKETDEVVRSAQSCVNDEDEHVKKAAIDKVCQLMGAWSRELEKETEAELAATQSRVSSIMNRVQKGMEEKFKQMEKETDEVVRSAQSCVNDNMTDEQKEAALVNFFQDFISKTLSNKKPTPSQDDQRRSHIAKQKENILLLVDNLQNVDQNLDHVLAMAKSAVRGCMTDEEKESVWTIFLEETIRCIVKQRAIPKPSIQFGSACRPVRLDQKDDLVNLPETNKAADKKAVDTKEDWILTFPTHGLRVDLMKIYDKCCEIAASRDRLALLSSTLSEMELANSFIVEPYRPIIGAVQMRANMWDKATVKTTKANLLEEESRLRVDLLASSKKHALLESHVNAFRPEIILWMRKQLFDLAIGKHVWIIHHPAKHDQSSPVVALYRYRIVHMLTRWRNAEYVVSGDLSGTLYVVPTDINKSTGCRDSNNTSADGGRSIRYVADYNAEALKNDPELNNVCFLPSPFGNDIERTLISAAFSKSNLSFIF